MAAKKKAAVEKAKKEKAAVEAANTKTADDIEISEKVEAEA